MISPGPNPSELELTHLTLSLSFSVSSAVAITWTNAPENQFPTLGTNYVVKCEVKADPNPTIDWLRNGDPVSLPCTPVLLPSLTVLSLPSPSPLPDSHRFQASCTG